MMFAPLACISCGLPPQSRNREDRSKSGRSSHPPPVWRGHRMMAKSAASQNSGLCGAGLRKSVCAVILYLRVSHCQPGGQGPRMEPMMIDSRPLSGLLEPQLTAHPGVGGHSPALSSSSLVIRTHPDTSPAPVMGRARRPPSLQGATVGALKASSSLTYRRAAAGTLAGRC